MQNSRKAENRNLSFYENKNSSASSLKTSIGRYELTKKRKKYIEIYDDDDDREARIVRLFIVASTSEVKRSLWLINYPNGKVIRGTWSAH